MRGLKIAVAVMSALILAGLVVVGVTVVRRLSTPAPGVVDVLLPEPAGTKIVGITTLPDRVAVLLQGGGPDRIRLLNPRTLQSEGEVRLRQ
jgi:hypothetical protein